MARTVEQLKDSILEYGFARTQYTGAIIRWIDEGQRYIFRRAKLRNKEEAVEFTTTPSVTNYSILPSNFAQVTYVLNKSTNPESNLDSVHDLKKFNELDGVSPNTPAYYIIDKNEVKLWPTPDDEYEMEFRYSKIPSTIIEEASSSPSIAEDYFQLLEEYALWKAFSRENDREESEYHKRIFDEGIIEFTGQMDHAKDDTPDQIQGLVEPDWQ